MAFRLNSLFEEVGVDPKNVALILHSTTIPKLRRMLPVLASEYRDLFKVYQSVHSPKAEATLVKRQYAASFVPAEGGKLTFAGFYIIAATPRLAVAEIYKDRRFVVLERDFGAWDTGPERNVAKGGAQVRFELSPVDALESYIGKLQIRTPTGRTYVRLAENLDPEVAVLSVENLLLAPAPEWVDFIVDGPQMRVLPQSWSARLREWRGVYLIVDAKDGARYVGSAYGADNLLGRWQAHVRRDRGVTKELKKRDPANFRFSILQLVGPDAAPRDVLKIEHSWMDRLHTREYGLNA